MVQVVAIGSGEVHAAPFENGPRAEIVVGMSAADGLLGAVAVTLPPGGAMPEHAHGDSAVVVVPREGRVVLQAAEFRQTLEPGTVAVIGVGERVSLANAGDGPASLLAIVAPAGFLRAFADWPALAPAAGP